MKIDEPSVLGGTPAICPDIPISFVQRRWGHGAWLGAQNLAQIHAAFYIYVSEHSSRGGALVNEDERQRPLAR